MPFPELTDITILCMARPSQSIDAPPIKPPESSDKRPMTGKGHWLVRWGQASTRIVIESLLLGFAIVFVVIWFWAPYFVRDYINRGLSGLPDYTGRVEWVRIHPLTASIDIYDFHIDKRATQIPVHFFYSPRWYVALQWSELLHGVARASVTIFNPRINLVAGPSSDQSQISISKVWIDAIKELIPWRVNQLLVHDGDVHFLD